MRVGLPGEEHLSHVGLVVVGSKMQGRQSIATLHVDMTAVRNEALSRLGVAVLGGDVQWCETFLCGCGRGGWLMLLAVVGGCWYCDFCY